MVQEARRRGRGGRAAGRARNRQGDDRGAGPAAGVLAGIEAKDGETVAVGALLGQIKEGAGAPAAAKPAAAPAAAKPAEAPKAAAPAAPASDAPLAPSVRRIAAETGIDPATVPGTGKDGRVIKGDMLAAIERAASSPTPVPQTPPRFRSVRLLRLTMRHAKSA